MNLRHSPQPVRADRRIQDRVSEGGEGCRGDHSALGPSFRQRVAVMQAGPAGLARHRQEGFIGQRCSGHGAGVDEVLQVRLAPGREVDDDLRHCLTVAAVAERAQQSEAGYRDLPHQEAVEGHAHVDVAPGELGEERRVHVRVQRRLFLRRQERVDQVLAGLLIQRNGD